MPTSRHRAALPRSWTLCALVLAICAHLYVLDRLLHLSPDASPRPVREAMRVEDILFEFAPAAPEAKAVPSKPDVATLSPPLHRVSPTPRRVRPAVVTEQPVDDGEPAAVLPEASAADLLRQVGRVAAESVQPQPTERRWLDLGVRADPDTGAIAVQRRSAGLGGAPTRADMAPVGDLANGMLIERWQEMHHGNGSQDCSKQPEGEPLSSYLARCRQGL